MRIVIQTHIYISINQKIFLKNAFYFIFNIILFLHQTNSLSADFPRCHLLPGQVSQQYNRLLPGQLPQQYNRLIHEF